MKLAITYDAAVEMILSAYSEEEYAKENNLPNIQEVESIRKAWEDIFQTILTSRYLEMIEKHGDNSEQAQYALNELMHWMPDVRH